MPAEIITNRQKDKTKGSQINVDSLILTSAYTLFYDDEAACDNGGSN